MDQINVKIKTEVVGIQMMCIHCNEEIEDGDCDESENNIAVDLTACENEGNMVLSDVKCPACGSNTFVDVIGYVKVTLE